MADTNADEDQVTTLPSGKQAILPPPEGKSSPLYDALPAEGGDSPNTSDFLKRFDPARIDALGHELAGIERQRGDAEQKQFGALESRMDRDRQQMEKAYRAEGAAADSIPPMWNADKERQDRERGPIESFASIGSIFGLLASQFTKTPLTSALNASAAAMNAVHQHDEQAYQSAYQAWKDNTALALKRFGMEREMFEDANKFISTDLQSWKVKQLAIAAQFDNKKAIAMLDAGMDGDLLKMQDAQIKAAEGVVKAREDWETYDVRRSVFSAETKAWDADHPDAKPQQRALARLEIMKDITEGGKNIQMDVLRKFRVEHPDATAEEEAKFLAEHPVYGGTRASGAPTPDKVALQKFMQEHPDATAEQIQAFNQRSKALRSAPTAAVNKYLQEHPDATSDDIAQFSAKFQTIAKAEKDFSTGKQGQQLNSLNVGIAHIQTLRDLGDALKNSDIKKFNELAQNWAEQTGNPAPTNFDTAKQIVGTEIMKALIAGGGGVGERETLQANFNRANSPLALKGVADTAEELLAAQFEGLGLQYKKTTERNDFEERMTPEALSVFKRIEAKKVKPESVAVPPGAKGDPEGQVYHKGGWRWEKRGNQIVPVAKEGFGKRSENTGAVMSDAAPIGGAGAKLSMMDDTNDEGVGTEGMIKNFKYGVPAAGPGRAPTIISPPSPKVQQAIDRLKAWLPINERNGPNSVMRKNIEIMERGGPTAESMAAHTLKTWNEPPRRGISAPTIDSE